MASKSAELGPTNTDHGQAFNRQPRSNLEMRSNTIVAGSDVGIAVGAETHDPLKETLKLAEWLSPVNSPQIQKDISEKVMEGTGGWIFKQPRFVDWINKEKKVLWATGIPGAGKTCLTSIVIDHLLKDRNATPIYVYCQYKEQLSTTEILACLFRQAVLRSEEVETFVSDLLYRPSCLKSTRPSKAELLETLHGALQLLDDVYLVVDALDELDNNVRPELVSDLISLQQPLFMTSRMLPNLPHIHEPDFTIGVQDEELRSFVSRKVDAIPRLLRHLQQREVREEVITRIQDRCQGMFLLAALQIDVLGSEQIIDQHSLGEAIEQLPKTLNEQYEYTWKRIRGQDSKAWGLACRAIVMVTYATRILKVAELLAALTVDIDAGSIDRECRTTPKTLVSITFGLLTIETGCDTVRLIHDTAQDFFESLNDPPFDNPHALIADISAVYIHQTRTDTGFKTISDSLNNLSHPFLNYACSDLGHHTSQALRYNNGHIPEQLSKLFRNRQSIPIPLTSLGGRIDLGQAIHFAALHGLMPLIEDNRSAFHERSSLGYSPLFYACLGAKETVVRLLLHSAGLDDDAKDEKRIVPLHLASKHDHKAVVQLLLSSPGINVNPKDESGASPLHLASEHGHESVVRLLLDSPNIDINAKDESGNTPLHLASEHGHESVVRLLLNSPNIDINAKDESGNIPLHPASEHGHESVVRLLLDSLNIDVNAKDGSRNIPLHLAIKHGHESVVRLLLNSPNIDINAKDESGTTPLHLASEHGHLIIVQLLLNSPGIDVNPKDGNGNTPLHLAARNGQEKVVHVLVTLADADTNAKNKDGRSPSYLAAKNGHNATVHRIAEFTGMNIDEPTDLDVDESTDIDVDTRDGCGRESLGIPHLVHPLTHSSKLAAGSDPDMAVEHTLQNIPLDIHALPEWLLSPRADIAGASAAVKFLEEGHARIFADIQDGLLSLGYCGEFIVQAGFNEELLDGGIEHEEIFVILEKDFIANPANISKVLLPSIEPFSGIIYTPSSLYMIPPAPDVVNNDTMHAPPMITTLRPDGNPGSLPVTSTSDQSGQANTGSQSGRQVNSTHNGSQPPAEANNEETKPLVKDSDTLHQPTPPIRRILRLKLCSPLTLEVAGTPVRHIFTLRTLIEIELSSNPDTGDEVEGEKFENPWCSFKFEFLHTTSNFQKMYSFKQLHIAADVNPSDTWPTDLTISQDRVVNKVMHRTEQQRETSSGLGIGHGVEYKSGASQREITSSESIKQPWEMKPHFGPPLAGQDRFGAEYKYTHNSPHNTIQTIDGELFKPGPHCIFSSALPVDERNLAIKIKMFWSSTSSLASPSSGTSTWRRLLNRSLQNNQRLRPFVFANFWHELSFNLDLSKIQVGRSFGERTLGRDEVDDNMLQQPGTSFHSEHVEVKRAATDRAVQFTIPLRRAVIHALTNGEGATKRIESPAN